MLQTRNILLACMSAFMMLGSLVLTLTISAQPTQALAVRADLAGWNKKQTITLSSTVALTNYQVKIVLGNSNFNFSLAKPDGSDIRFTDSDAVTLLPFWIESYDAVGGHAVIWVKVPSIPANTNKLIGLFSQNPAATSASDGNATFEFFDDFNLQAAGYFTLSTPTKVLTATLPWENSAIHTLSVVEMNRNGYQYWGYYGLEGSNGNIGRAYSNDLVDWVKDPSNPLLSSSEDARWPSVITHSGTLYMVYNYLFTANPSIVMRTSADGITFSPLQTLVPDTASVRKGNPNIFFNPTDNQFYLYWYESDSTVYTISVRSAANAVDLATAPTTVLLTSTNVLAAPDMMYYGGTYFLATEIKNGSIWQTQIYSGPSAVGPFTLLAGNPVLADGEACFFQHIFGNTLHAYYCKQTGVNGPWSLEHRTADLTAGQPQLPELDHTKWSPGGLETWSTVTAPQSDGTSGGVVQLTPDPNRTGPQVLLSSYTGSDYIAEVSANLTSGRVMGLGTRALDQDNLYAADLYEDLDAVNNFYLYRWQTSAVNLQAVPVGIVNLNTWYKLAFSAHGNNFNVALNGTAQITTTDSAFAAGRVALVGEAATVAQFDNLFVRKYSGGQMSVVVHTDPTAITLQRFGVRTPDAPDNSVVWLLAYVGLGLIGLWGWWRVSTRSRR